MQSIINVPFQLTSRSLKCLLEIPRQAVDAIFYLLSPSVSKNEQAGVHSISRHDLMILDINPITLQYKAG